MAKVFRPSTREASILSKIESSKEYARRKAIDSARDNADLLSNAIANKLVENKLVETTNKRSLEDQLHKCIEQLGRAEDFDIDYAIAPVRNLMADPNIVALYVTAFIIEKIVNHKDTVDVYGSDDEIYACILKQVTKILPA